MSFKGKLLYVKLIRLVKTLLIFLNTEFNIAKSISYLFFPQATLTTLVVSQMFLQDLIFKVARVINLKFVFYGLISL